MATQPAHPDDERSAIKEALASLPHWQRKDIEFQALKAAGQANDEPDVGPTSSLPLGEASSLPSQTELTEIGKALLADARKREERVKREADQTSARRGLSPEVKADIVELFACFQSVSHVEDMLKTRHGLKLDRRTIESFNPDSRRCQIGKRLRALFDQVRAGYITECAKVGVAHQAHRLRLIGTIVEKASNSKDFNAALKGLELAAKEMGAIGQTQTVEHKGVISHVHGSVDDARAEVAMRLQGLIDGGVLAAAPTVDTPTLPAPTGTP